MIIYRVGDIFQQNVEAIVNPVNCVGAMGKGLAKDFKIKYPLNYEQYRKACLEGRVEIGKMFTVPIFTYGNLKYIVNFPTKKHWRKDSEIDYIKSGLYGLVETVAKLNIRSIALPRLGVGEGHLDWQDVKDLMDKILGTLADTNIQVVVCEYNG